MTPKTIFTRLLNMKLPEGQSAFLWGARKTGKSFYLRERYPDSIYYNLLETDEFIRLTKEPYLLRREIQAHTPEMLKNPIIIDEVQKVPALLDEVHHLIESSSAYFILCGSSARKLKKEGANLLGGRAWRYEFYPLVYPEIPQFDLVRALNNGMIPSHYTAQNWKKTIKAYINDYLKEEIRAEGLARNLRAFSQFLDVAAFSNGELINYSNIARDCGVDAKTVKEYYQILVDTLLGYVIMPYHHKRKREDLVATPKFYYFDTGLVKGLTHQPIDDLKGSVAGKAFEHYILMELIAYRGIKDLDFDITFWRTTSGLEIDFVLGDAEIAIEVKISANPSKADLRGLISFAEEYQPKRTLVVCMAARPQKRELDHKATIDILPWKNFLEQLWGGDVL
jgi:predicted AAA+ superfamily ATPase